MSRRSLKKKETEGGGGAPGWMTTFSDLMSLLLTFFILLYSMSTVDAQKFKEISYSLQSVLSGLGQVTIIEGEGGQMPIPGGAESTGSETTETSPEILEMYQDVKNYVSEKELNAKVSVNMNQRGVFVDINEAILFESGSASIKESGLQVLKQLRGLINEFDNEIVIEGHTDNVPINRREYPSNWELSTARAVSVVRYLSEVGNVNPKRLSAIGYGEYRPMKPNDTSANREINRRVNILIIVK